MCFRDYYPFIVQEIEHSLELVNEKNYSEFVTQLLLAPSIFLAGAGRSGLIMRCFAMRLMHLGLQVRIIGEIITGAVKKDDVLLIGSGSGETDSLVSIAKKGKSLGVNLLLICTNSESSISKLANNCLLIPAPSPKLAQAQSFSSTQPMGNLFEQSLLVLLDSMACSMMNQMRMNSEKMFLNHANLE